MIEQAVEILYAITVSLKMPVIVGVLLALIWALYEFGGFLREVLERKRNASRHTEALSLSLEKANLPSSSVLMPLVGRFVTNIAKTAPPFEEARLQRLLQEAEFGAARRILPVRIGLRLGPVLGLMGTLIPMGPALMNISKGNLTVMSNDLVIAFSTTVVGLFVGLLCYVMLTLRQHWYARDIADIESLCDTLLKEPQS